MTIDEAISALALDVTPERRALLDHYLDLLLEWNTRLNLTAIRERDVAESRLIAESIAIAPLLPAETERLLDVGSGGGIPGIPLAILMPETQVDLLDATGKKVAAMSAMCAELGLDNARAIQGRAEVLAHRAEMRGLYTVVTARAVARLATLVEYTLPFLRPGGIAIFPKGESVQEEVREAQKAIQTLGGRLRDVALSPVNETRLVVIEQREATPAPYPRRTGIPARAPIGVPTR